MAENGDTRIQGITGCVVSNKDLSWEEKVRTLKEFVAASRMPCLVKIVSGDLKKFAPPELLDDDECVLHVLEMRRHKMILAKKLQWDRKFGDYQSSEKQLEVSIEQTGWFEVLPEDGQPVEYFDTISAITTIKPKQFLVRTSIVGYQLTIENGASCWMPWEIRPGEVLTTGIIHMDQKKTKRKTLFKRIFSTGKQGKKEQDLKYLQCFDRSNKEIMIPLIMTGVFSPVGDPSNANFDAVYEMQDLILAFSLPLKVQQIHTDSKTRQSFPSGVVQLEGLKDHDCLLVAKHPYVEDESKTFEIPLLADIQIIREKKKKGFKKQYSSGCDFEFQHQLENGKPEMVLSPSQVDLPVRVKESKRSKGSAILDKLSVRSKGKKERASLKALQEQGVFSSRLSKMESNYDDFFQTVDVDTPEDEKIEKQGEIVPNQANVGGQMGKTSEDKRTDCSGASVSSKSNVIQDRDLPPIPSKHSSPRSSERSSSHSDNTLYEELPVAPRPPSDGAKFYLDDEQDKCDDGYMTPAHLRNIYGPSSSNSEYSQVVKRKPPAAPREVKYARSRKVRSEIPQGLNFSVYDSNDPTNENIDEMFDFSSLENPYERRAHYNHYGPISPDRRDEFQPSNPRQKSNMYDDVRRFYDDAVLDQKPLTGFAKLKSKSAKNLLETNATVRSHNVRKMRTAMEVFNFSDSLRDLKQPFQPRDSQTAESECLSPEPTYGRMVPTDRVKSYVYGPSSGIPYAESEPTYRRYNRSSSMAGLSDSMFKQGDDSAISLCSRGDYGFPGDSEYSYSEYSEFRDDGWNPPEDISNLTVLEVSKSLRFIGMKDRVVIRFAHEQVDGKLLCSLDKKLLQEGFPELNALEIKKIMDFIGGWRPKK